MICLRTICPCRAFRGHHTDRHTTILWQAITYIQMDCSYKWTALTNELRTSELPTYVQMLLHINYRSLRHHRRAPSMMAECSFFASIVSRWRQDAFGHERTCVQPDCHQTILSTCLWRWHCLVSWQAGNAFGNPQRWTCRTASWDLVQMARRQDHHHCRCSIVSQAVSHLCMYVAIAHRTAGWIDHFGSAHRPFWGYACIRRGSEEDHSHICHLHVATQVVLRAGRA